MDLDAILDALAGLLDERADAQQAAVGQGNFRCEDCLGCSECRFCKGCERCQDCTYCEGCVDCRGCTQSKRSLGCVESSYVEDSRDCQRSRYLVLCVDCRDCTHCLGCVGLSGKEFHVLNQPLVRKEYFALLKSVQAQLEARVAEGWRVTDLLEDGDDAGADPADDERLDDDDPWTDGGDLAAAARVPNASLGLQRGPRPARPDPDDDRGSGGPPGVRAQPVDRARPGHERREGPTRAAARNRGDGDAAGVAGRRAVEPSRAGPEPGAPSVTATSRTRPLPVPRDDGPERGGSARDGSWSREGSARHAAASREGSARVKDASRAGSASREGSARIEGSSTFGAAAREGGARVGVPTRIEPARAGVERGEGSASGGRPAPDSRARQGPGEPARPSAAGLVGSDDEGRSWSASGWARRDQTGSRELDASRGRVEPGSPSRGGANELEGGRRSTSTSRLGERGGGESGVERGQEGRSAAPTPTSSGSGAWRRDDRSVPPAEAKGAPASDEPVAAPGGAWRRRDRTWSASDLSEWDEPPREAAWPDSAMPRPLPEDDLSEPIAVDDAGEASLRSLLLGQRPRRPPERR